MSLQDEALNNRICTAPNNSKDTIPRSEVVAIIEKAMTESEEIESTTDEPMDQAIHAAVNFTLFEILTKIQEVK